MPAKAVGPPAAHLPARLRIVARAREELSVCLRTEANVLARAERMEGGAAAELPSVLRDDAHASSAHAWREVASLLGGADCDMAELVGRELLVHWPLDRRWYHCVVLRHDSSREEAPLRVRYESDQVEEWLDLDAEEWRVCPQDAPRHVGGDGARVVGVGTALPSADAAPSPHLWWASPVCLLNAARSALCRRLYGEALHQLEASPHLYLRELSLGTRLAASERIGSDQSVGHRSHALALHTLAAAQAELLTRHKPSGGSGEGIEDEGSDSAMILPLLARFGVAVTIGMSWGAFSSRPAAALPRSADVEAEAAGEAVAETAAKVASEVGVEATTTEAGGVAGAENDAEEMAADVANGVSAEAIVVEEMVDLAQPSRPEPNANPAAVAAANIAAAAATAAAVATVTNDATSPATNPAAAAAISNGAAGASFDDDSDAPPSWSMLLKECEEGLGHCLRLDKFHHRSRLLLAHLAWTHGERAHLAKFHCEQLLTKSVHRR